MVRGCFARLGGLGACGSRIPLNLPSWVKGSQLNRRSPPFAGQKEHTVPRFDGAFEGHFDPSQHIGLADHPQELIIPVIQRGQPIVFQVDGRC